MAEGANPHGIFAAGGGKLPTQEKKIPTAFLPPGGPWCPHKKKKKKKQYL